MHRNREPPNKNVCLHAIAAHFHFSTDYYDIQLLIQRQSNVLESTTALCSDTWFGLHEMNVTF